MLGQKSLFSLHMWWGGEGSDNARLYEATTLSVLPFVALFYVTLQII